MRKRRTFQIEIIPVPDPQAAERHRAVVDQVAEGLAQHLLGAPAPSEVEPNEGPVERVLAQHRRAP